MKKLQTTIQNLLKSLGLNNSSRLKNRSNNVLSSFNNVMQDLIDVNNEAKERRDELTSQNHKIMVEMSELKSIEESNQAVIKNIKAIKSYKKLYIFI